MIGPGRASIEAHGGTPLVIGDVKEFMDGSRAANRIVVVEFPSIEAVNAWRDLEDGTRVREAIERNADFHGYTVEPKAQPAAPRRNSFRPGRARPGPRERNLGGKGK